MPSEISEWVRQGGTWIGLIGGLAGLYTFLASIWRRRMRLAVDYSQGNDAHDSWHRFTITNRSDLAIAFRYLGPAWFLTTPLGRQVLNFAFDTEDADPALISIGPHASLEFVLNNERFERASPVHRREAAYLRVGVVIPRDGKIRWIKPRSQRNWDLSLRERWIHTLYGLWDTDRP